MHLGIFSYNVEYGARPDELARAAEDRGLVIWVGETRISRRAARRPTRAGARSRSPTTTWPTRSCR